MSTSSTTRTEAVDAIASTFLTAWGTTTPVLMENEEHRGPATKWVRLSVRHYGGGQDTLGPRGSRRFLRTGAALVQVFTPSNGGRADADALAQSAAAVFEGVSLDGTTVRFREVVTRESGVDGKWYGMVVEARFEYDERL